MKNRKKMVLKAMCFLDIDLSSLFFDFSRFWLDFGRPRRFQKSIKNRKKFNKIAKNRKKVDFETGAVRREGSGGVLAWEGFGSILDAFLKRFWWILEGFGMDFGRILGRFLEGFDLTNDD